eukprot:COSAG05_NODE_994_length_6264_cov_3.618329_7_plen_287_part_00
MAGVPALCAAINQELVGIQSQPQPAPAQLAQFLQDLVGKLGVIIGTCQVEVGHLCQAAFASVGWDVLANAPGAAEPPEAVAVLQMLQGLLAQLSAGPPQAPPQVQQPAPQQGATGPTYCAQCKTLINPPGQPIQGQIDDTVGMWYCFKCWAAWDSGAPDTSGALPAVPAASPAETDRAHMYSLAQQRLKDEAAAKLEADKLAHEAGLERARMETEEKQRQHELQVNADEELEAARLKQAETNNALQLEREKLAMELEMQRQEMEFKRAQVCGRGGAMRTAMRLRSD